MASVQGIFDFALPIPIGNGILLSGFSKQWETKALILRHSKFSMHSSTLPLHGTIPPAVPLSRGCSDRAPEGFCLLAHACVELGVQCTSGVALFFFNILPGGVKLFSFWTLWLGAQQSGALHKGRLVEVQFLELLLHEESVGLSGHASPSGQSLGHGRLGLCSWHHSQGIQMSNSLLGSLMSELSHHLHFMSGFLESSLLGCDFYHVARQRVYAHQLVGVMK